MQTTERTHKRLSPLAGNTECFCFELSVFMSERKTFLCGNKIFSVSLWCFTRAHRLTDFCPKLMCFIEAHIMSCSDLKRHLRSAQN